MNIKYKVLPLLLVLAVFAGSASAATGNVDLLCSAVSDDLSVAGGCVDDDGLEDTVTSSSGLFILEAGDKAGILILFLVVAFIAGVVFKIRKQAK